jgi:hypothetical protein
MSYTRTFVLILPRRLHPHLTGLSRPALSSSRLEYGQRFLSHKNTPTVHINCACLDRMALALFQIARLR